MLRDILLNLTPHQRDVIVLWRILYYPKKLSSNEIVKISGYKKHFVCKTLKTFNKDCKMKLAQHSWENDIKDAIRSYYCGS